MSTMGANADRLPGADRLRFLGMISRYAALIATLGLDEISDEI